VANEAKAMVAQIAKEHERAKKLLGEAREHADASLADLGRIDPEAPGWQKAIDETQTARTQVEALSTREQLLAKALTNARLRLARSDATGAVAAYERARATLTGKCDALAGAVEQARAAVKRSAEQVTVAAGAVHEAWGKVPLESREGLPDPRSVPVWAWIQHEGPGADVLRDGANIDARLKWAKSMTNYGNEPMETHQ
jgi:hypothetical protein